MSRANSAASPARDRVLRSSAYRAAEGRAVAIVAAAMRASRERPWATPAVGDVVVEAAIRRACAETPGATDDLGAPGRPLRALDLLLRRAASVRGAALNAVLCDDGGAP